jgi:hypothetical protein
VIAFPAVLLFSAALLVAGCGGSDSDGASTSGAVTSTAPASTTPTAPAPTGATTFTDPAGVYRVDVADSWREATIDQPKAWIVAEVADGFAPNVNVVTEKPPSSIGLDDYLKLSVDKAPQIIQDFTLESNETITLTSGDQGGRLVYTGRSGASPTLKFLAIVALRDGRAAVATFTAPPGRFDALAADAEPYLRTLEILDT